MSAWSVRRVEDKKKNKDKKRKIGEVEVLVTGKGKVPPR